MHESERKTLKNETEEHPEPQYEAPGIDAVMTPDELEREILYAGDSSLIQMGV